MKCPSEKRRFTSERKADAALGRIWSKPRPGRRMETRSYRCPDCNGWHLTSQPNLERPVPPQPIRLEAPVPKPPSSCPCCTSPYLPVLHNARCASGLHPGGCGHTHAQHLAARPDRRRAA